MASLQVVIAALAALLCLHSVSEAAQCFPDPNNPCKATCNGTQFDISNLFDYP